MSDESENRRPDGLPEEKPPVSGRGRGGTEKKTQGKRFRLPEKLKKPLLIAAIVLAALLLVYTVFAVFFPNALESVRRRLNYLGRGKGDGYGEVRFDSNSSNSYAGFRNMLCVSTEGGMTLYSEYGEELGIVQGSMPYPNVRAGDRSAVCFSADSGYLGALDKNGKTLLSETFTQKVLDADVSDDGYLCYLLTDDVYKAVATVLNPKQQMIYRWSASSMYVNNCAVSDGGKYVALIGLHQSEGMFASSLVLLDTKKETPVQTVPLGDQVIYELFFLSEDRICAVGENSALFLNTAGKLLGEYDYGDLYLADYCRTSEGDLVLELNRSKAGSRMELSVFDSDGGAVANTYLGAGVKSVSAGGKYIAALTDEGVTVYSRRLETVAGPEKVENAGRVLARSDGSVWLIGNGTTAIYIP